LSQLLTQKKMTEWQQLMQPQAEQTKQAEQKENQ
jgi:hypothetical protein